MISYFLKKKKAHTSCPNCKKLESNIKYLKLRISSLESGKIVCSKCKIDEVKEKGDWCRLCIDCHAYAI